MSATRLVLTSATAAALVVLATTGVVTSFRGATAVLVGAVVAGGQRWRTPMITAGGLLGLVVVVGAGPAGTAGPIGLLAWAVPTWAVVLVAASNHPPTTPTDVPPRDVRTRLRRVGPEVTVVVACIPLVVMAASPGQPAALWAAAAGVALVVLLLVATARGRPSD